jgi:signal transduction histidine kinase
MVYYMISNMDERRPIYMKFLLFLAPITFIILISLFFLTHAILGPSSSQTRVFLFSAFLFVLGSGAALFIFNRLTAPLVKEIQSIRQDLASAPKSKEITEVSQYSQRQIIQAETHKSLTSIVSGFAHEINNPLTGILGYIDLIELNSELSLYMKKRLEGIKDQAVRIKDIIDDLNQLDPEVEQVKSKIDLSNLLEKLLKIIGKQEENKQIILEKDFVAEEVVVFGNHFALFQVFEGVIENSIEAIKDRGVPEGKIRVVLRIGSIQDLAVTEIIDNGGGFECIDKAFNPFYTTKNRTQKKGIGLSIAFNLVQEHKGNIYIANTGEGAVVSIYLPLFKETQKQEAIEDEIIEVGYDNPNRQNIDKKNDWRILRC